jgi:hypothetical protein
VSWFTFRDLFLRCHLRPICAPALSIAGFARDQLSHAITGRPSSALDEVSPKSAVRKEANRVRVSGSSESAANQKCLNALRRL